MGAISVLVVDDHAVFADAVRARLEMEQDLAPVAVAYSLGSAVLRMATLRPDVAVVDLRLGDGTAVDFAERAREISPQTRIVVLSAADQVEAMVQAVLKGVRVWLPKTVQVQRLVRAIRMAHEGGAWLPNERLGPVLDALTARASGANQGPLDRLSHRELAVLQLLAEGKSRSDIAAELHLSVNTIRSHVQNLTAKLAAHSALEAVAVYHRLSHDA